MFNRNPFLVVLFLSLFQFQCHLFEPLMPSIQGRFGYHLEKTREKSRLEELTERQREYLFGDHPITLTDQDTLHYIYEFSGSPSSSLSLEVVLEHLPLDPIRYTPISPFPIYLEKKSKVLEEEVSYIWDSYKNLSPGSYRILIVYDHKVLDSKSFEVIPINGYISQERELEMEEKGIVDDLARYSR